MDRTSTNWEVFRLLKEHQNEEEEPSLFLYWKLQTSFQIGNSKTNWNVGKILKAMWQLFCDSPARRDIYITVPERHFI